MDCLWPSPLEIRMQASECMSMNTCLWCFFSSFCDFLRELETKYQLFQKKLKKFLSLMLELPRIQVTW